MGEAGQVERRPTQPAPERRLAAARRIADLLAKDGHIKLRDLTRAAEDIAKHGRRGSDGYDLAKALDDHCHWNCNLEMAETLDGFSCELIEEIKEAEKDWVKRNSIEPPLPIGTHIRTCGGQAGVITDIYEYGAAKYLVAIDGDPHAHSKTRARLIVNFEDAHLVVLAQAEEQEHH